MVALNPHPATATTPHQQSNHCHHYHRRGLRICPNHHILLVNEVLKYISNQVENKGHTHLIVVYTAGSEFVAESMIGNYTMQCDVEALNIGRRGVSPAKNATKLAAAPDCPDIPAHTHAKYPTEPTATKMCHVQDQTNSRHLPSRVPTAHNRASF